MDNEYVKKYSFRTDLVHESLTHYHQTNKIKVVEKIDDIEVTKALIDQECSNLIAKKPGIYYTISFVNSNFDNQEKIGQIFEKYLATLLKETNISKNDRCLVIGLGNPKSTPDALGPCVIERIFVTNHLPDCESRPVCAIAPGVTGETGIETSELIKGLVMVTKPNFLIVIDALAASSIARVNHTIQMGNTGIAPGSGVGNSRKEISFSTLNIPVIAIGVPTVVDAATLVTDTVSFLEKHYTYQKEYQEKPAHKLAIGTTNYLKKDIKVSKDLKKNLLGMIGTLNEEEIKSLFEEVLTPIGYNLMVTPKEVDFILEQFAELIGFGINHVLNQQFFKTKNDRF